MGPMLLILLILIMEYLTISIWILMLGIKIMLFLTTVKKMELLLQEEKSVQTQI